MISFIKQHKQSIAAILLIVGVLTQAIPVGAFDAKGGGNAIFNTDPDDYPVVEVSNYTQNPGCSTCWGPSVSNVRAGDTLSFEFFYHNTSNVTAHYSRASLSFSGSGSHIVATGRIWAENASAVTETVTINAAPGHSIEMEEDYMEYGIGEVTPGMQNFLVVRLDTQSTSGGGGGGGNVPPTVTLRATYNGQNVSRVVRGTAPTLVWTSQNATECHKLAGAGFDTDNATSGSDVVSALAGDTTFSIQCTGPGGSQNANATVTVFDPGVRLWATHNGSVVTQVPVGTAPTLHWISNQATQCWKVAGAGFDTGNAPSGSDVVSPLAGTTTFSVRCSGFPYPGDSVLATATVDVTNVDPPQGNAPLVITQPATNIYISSALVNGRVNPNGASTSYWFEWGTSTSLGNSTTQQSAGSGTAYQDVFRALTGLYPSTTYYFRVVAQNQHGTARGSILSFTTNSDQQPGGYAPLAYTQAASAVSQSSALLNGQVNPNGASTSYWFEWGTNNALGYSTIHQNAGSNASMRSVSAPLSGLSSNTTYYFRVVAQNQHGTARGSIMSFTTTGGTSSGNAPIVITTAASGVSATAAIVNGQVNPNGASTSYWFEWGTSNALGSTTNHNSIGSGSSNQNIFASLTNLSDNTTYYFRAVAQNQYGTTRGSILSFVTQNGGSGGSSPIAITLPASQIGQVSALLNGQVNPNGASTSYWFEWGTSASLGSSTASQSVGSGSLLLTAVYPLNGLTANTTYYYRIVAQNSVGTARGSVVSFTTQSGGGDNQNPPYVQTLPASSVNTGGAVLNGQVNPNGSSTSVWFEWGTSYALGYTTSSISAGAGSISSPFNQIVYNLSSNTTYYFRAVAQNQYGLAQGTILSFTTGSGGGNDGETPEAQTTNADFIDEDSARLYGEVNPHGYTTSYWFEYGDDMTLDNSTTMISAGAHNGWLTVNQSIYNLRADEIYYYRVVAMNQYGTDYGVIRSFRTDDDGNDDDDDEERPIVRTESATNIDDDSARLRGTVDANGDDTYAWFEYGTDEDDLRYETDSFYVGDETYTENISKIIDGLRDNTRYYFRAIARNDYGTGRGSILSFRTDDDGGSDDDYEDEPFVITQGATAISTTAALLNGSVDPNNNSTSAWFEWGLSPSNLSFRTFSQSMGSGSGFRPFSAPLTSLVANSTYYYRAVAENGEGRAYGSILSFVTSTSGGGGGGTIIINNNTTTGGSGISCLILVPALNVSQLDPGEEFVFTVTYRNGCNYTLSNAFLKVILPTEVTFLSTNYPFFNRDANGLSYNLGVVSPGMQSSISISGQLSNRVQRGDTLIFSTVLNFNDDDGDFQSVSAYLSAVVGVGQTLGANILEAFGDLFGNWLFILFLLLLILFLIWWIFFKKDEEEEKVDPLADDRDPHYVRRS